VTQQLIDDTEGAVRAVRRETANIAARYSFNEGKLKGFAVGTSARYAMGKAAPHFPPEEWWCCRNDDRRLRARESIRELSPENRRFACTLQLNVNNVLGVHSDQGNSYTWPRYTEPRQYVTTATVGF
jgi:hypothetical protein